MHQTEKEILALFLPAGILEWFALISGKQVGKEIQIILEEKNIPPITAEERGKKVVSKGFKEITITDFPVRGKRVMLTFRRRYWAVEGRTEYLKREIPLCAEGTYLEKEFANFLKARSGD